MEAIELKLNLHRALSLAKSIKQGIITIECEIETAIKNQPDHEEFGLFEFDI